MNFIKTLAVSLCAASVTAGILKMLAPKGGLGRIMRAATGVFFILCILLPIAGNIHFSISAADEYKTGITASELSETVRQQTAQLINRQVGEEVKQIVEKEWKKGADIRVVSHISDNGNIEIEKTEVDLYGADENDREMILAKIKEELGITAIISLK